MRHAIKQKTIPTQIMQKKYNFISHLRRRKKVKGLNRNKAEDKNYPNNRPINQKSREKVSHASKYCYTF